MFLLAKIVLGWKDSTQMNTLAYLPKAKAMNKKVL